MFAQTWTLSVVQFCIFLFLVSAPPAAGAPKVNPANYTQPNGFLPFGMNGVVTAASSVFFAYGETEPDKPVRPAHTAHHTQTYVCCFICFRLCVFDATLSIVLCPPTVGFDMIAGAAEEARNPQRDIPLATAICLGVCTLLYAAASTVIVGELLGCSAAASVGF